MVRKFPLKSKSRLAVLPRVNRRSLTLLFAIASILPPARAQQEAVLSVTVTGSAELVVVIQPVFHAQYGCAYPLSYQFDISGAGTGLKASRKYRASDSYVFLQEKRGDSLFNAVEAARFDYASQRAYLSASFSGVTDSLFLRITDSLGNGVLPRYLGISRYYDNRRAAVTVTSDDWADWTEGWYPSLLGIFRRHGLYVTSGIISGATNTTKPTWTGIQDQLNMGYVEAAAHSRTHPHTPYAQPDSEVLGCERDIRLLSLPPLFSMNNAGYVYVWLAPYGDYDSSTDSLLGMGQSLLSPWIEKTGHFAPVNPTLEIGAPSWGGGDTSITWLNGTFDAIAAQGGVYHFMWHPQVIITDTAKPYFINHLDYVSNRPDIWYVNLGHLYLYHMIQEMNSTGLAAVAVRVQAPGTFSLAQNYPNPFNPSTTVRYNLPVRTSVHLAVFDVLGQCVATLDYGVLDAGTHEVRFDGTNLASGAYFCRLIAGEHSATKRLLLVR
jgi:hypothetical protein